MTTLQWTLLIFFVTLPVAFAPTIIAVRRQHANALAIFLINFFAGWTLIGWLVALVWSVLKKENA